MSSPPIPQPPRESLAVYVDGFNLYWGMHGAYARRFLWLDLVELARRLRPRSRLVAVKYFTTPVVGEPAAQSRQATYNDALLARHPSLFSIYYGRYQTKPIECRSCGSTWDHREEKETDVNIAVQLVADAAERKMKSALLLSADSDLAPAVRVAQRINPRLFVAAAFPPQRFSSELKALMPSSFRIGQSKLSASQMPEEFSIQGRTFKRPSKWQ